MNHVLSYQVAGVEHDTGRKYETISKIGILRSSEAWELVERWNSLARTDIKYTVLSVDVATREQQEKIDLSSQFFDGNVFRSSHIEEVCKTEGVIKVLQQLDADEDAPCHYQEIVDRVAKELSITSEKLESELTPFI